MDKKHTLNTKLMISRIMGHGTLHRPYINNIFPTQGIWAWIGYLVNSTWLDIIRTMYSSIEGIFFQLQVGDVGILIFVTPIIDLLSHTMAQVLNLCSKFIPIYLGVMDHYNSIDHHIACICLENLSSTCELWSSFWELSHIPT